uniref:Uncharacterized protein n=1 Tax=Amazona collaria TaxID=241587 RepID=A0A8B9IU18_9PSIT
MPTKNSLNSFYPSNGGSLLARIFCSIPVHSMPFHTITWQCCSHSVLGQSKREQPPPSSGLLCPTGPGKPKTSSRKSLRSCCSSLFGGSCWGAQHYCIPVTDEGDRLCRGRLSLPEHAVWGGRHVEWQGRKGTPVEPTRSAESTQPSTG